MWCWGCFGGGYFMAGLWPELDIYAIVGIGFILVGTMIINVFSSSVNH
ncbi:hypothetical protein JCM19239_1425 [Vibrio variabilis]|uniref:Uncharacterized protein n=1 Tax=Vibrio variabilis TaxID=990271 RepID=A0ABQ0JPG8_9VIBR|nr:hypothetical protein JCM19239_1425 [Vibrio variabilis]